MSVESNMIGRFSTAWVGGTSAPNLLVVQGQLYMHMLLHLHILEIKNLHLRVSFDQKRNQKTLSRTTYK